MASTGVLPFVRGIDFSRNDFSSDLFPSAVADMTGLRWMKLNRVNLERVPEELSQLKNLEHLQMVRNGLSSVHGELSDLPCLRSVIVRHNNVRIKTSGIPTDVFDMKDLTIVDFSHNSLKDVPPNLDHAKCAIVLNLSHNLIESIPNQLFVNMIDLLHLDLSHNRLEMLPPQIRRLTELQALILNDNPLQHFQLKQLPSMTQLRVLHMRNTQRSAANIPPTLDNLVNLEDVDVSMNELTEVPDAFFKLRNLRKLNLSHNHIQKLVPFCDCWENLVVLNLSRNKLMALPDILVRMTKLKKLLVNDNELTFEGIPTGIGKLVQLEVFHAAFNNLELVPEGLCRCVKLKRLKLNNNRLITMPDSIHYLSDLTELDVRNNPDLVMPPKPTDYRRKMQYYNIDFSLSTQIRLAGAQSPSSSLSSTPPPASSRKEGQAKLNFLRRRKHSANKEADSDQQKVLQGMTEIAKERDRADQAALEQQSSLRPKKWDEALEKPNMNYAEIFDEEVGHTPGLRVWEIENFYPNLLDEAFHGKFYEADCYIILKASLQDTGSMDYNIYYWIGERCSLDKKACAAIHAVNLRNFLGATCRTEREEMNEESDEFIELFGEEIVYIEGGRTASGFYTIEQVNHPTRLYRISPMGSQIHVEPVSVSPESLDPRFVFLLDAGQNMFVWSGRKCKGVLRSKTRLFAEKVNKNERKGNSEIESVSQDQDSEEFWAALCGRVRTSLEDPIVEHVPSDFHPPRPILYHVCLGMGYLELPQVEVKKGQLKQEMLQTKHVYILDCQTDIFMWIGKKSTRLVRAAGSKIAAELHAILNRPEHACVNRVCEGTESMLFKSKFVGWDDVIAVDFTRTADSVQRRGADLKVIMERDKMRTDLQALFLERQQVMPDSEAEQLMEECNEDLEYMEPFVLEGKKFVRLPDKEYGIFYTMDCYVFLCRYWMPPLDDDDPGSEKEGEKAGEEGDGGGDDFQCVVYFWQGRQASNMGWLTFTFSLQKKFESLFKDKLEVVRMYQQQENQKFLSHFKKKFVIRRGRRNLSMFPGARMWPELYHLRSNGSIISTRTIQVDATSDQLNSEFCFILKVPYQVMDDDGNRGRVYMWRGSKSGESETTVEEVANDVLNPDNFPVEKLTEGEEPEEFWDSLKGGKKAYETSADFMRFSRLFRCTNEKGYFTVSEKTIDFCQDDLDDDDIMILDTGDQVFIWVGSRASEVEVKLAYKAAQVYVQHMKLKQPERPRKLFVTLKGKESKRFSRSFHAWSKHKTAAGD